MSLKGKVAVVTGGAKGIGKACSLQLAKDGAAVAVWDLDLGGAKATAEEINKSGGKAIACLADVSTVDGIASAHEQTKSALGAVSILVNNAGMTGFVPFMDITEEAWDKMMRVNLRGPFFCCKAMLPDMLAAKWGRIINITSSSTQTGAPAMAHYISSKGGLGGLTRALALEYAAHGVTVNAVPPGFIDTPMLRASPVDVDGYAATMPMKRSGQPEDIACAVSYLASEGAAYVTGQTISVNGGRYFL